MKNPKYQLKGENDLTVFNFISEGPKGKIPKLIEIKETNLKGFYNLAFGDKDLETGKINDLIVTNNNDTEKVLATVVGAVYAFTDIIQMLGFTQLEVQKQELDCTEWE